MSAPRYTQSRDNQDRYFHPRNVNGYWRAAMRRELEKLADSQPKNVHAPAVEERQAA